MFNRRDLLQSAALATALLPAARGAVMPARSSRAKNLAEAHTIWAKLNGDLSGRTVYVATLGDVWGFKPQADDLAVEDFARRAYGYASVLARKMIRRPGSIVVRQKGWSFYRNPQTGLIGDKIPNLWTGAVDTASPLSGPVSEHTLSLMPASPAAPDPYDLVIRTLGRHAFVSTSNMIRFQSTGTSWFKLEGNLASYQCAIQDLENPALTHIPNTYSQNLVAEWQTWTHMHGQPGHILFKGDGVPLFDPADIPGDVQGAIRDFFPGQLEEVAAWS